MRVLCALALALAVFAVTSVSARPERNDPEIIEVSKTLDRVFLRKPDFKLFRQVLRAADFKIAKRFGKKNKEYTFVIPNTARLTALLEEYPVASSSGTYLLITEHRIFRSNNFFDPGAIADFTPLLEKRKNSEVTATSEYSRLFGLGNNLKVGTSKFGLFIDGHRVEKIYKAKNGIVYIIDGDLHDEDRSVSLVPTDRYTIAQALNILTPDNLMYDLSTKFARIFTTSKLIETSGDTIVDPAALLNDNQRRFLVVMPSNSYIKERHIKKALKKGVANLNTKIIMEHTFELTRRINRGTLFNAVDSRGQSFTLPNLHGRDVVFDITTLPYGKRVLTIDGNLAEPDFFEVICTNGLLLPMRGMLWHNYGPNK